MRILARVILVLLAGTAGVLLFPRAMRAFFVLRQDELPWGVVALAPVLLLLPLVGVAALLPRAGGLAIVGISVSSALALATLGNLSGSWLGLVFDAALFLVGLGFMWVGGKPKHLPLT
jgi:hypothetical protein